MSSDYMFDKLDVWLALLAKAKPVSSQIETLADKRLRIRYKYLPDEKLSILVREPIFKYKTYRNGGFIDYERFRYWVENPGRPMPREGFYDFLHHPMEVVFKYRNTFQFTIKFQACKGRAAFPVRTVLDNGEYHMSYCMEQSLRPIRKSSQEKIDEAMMRLALTL
jgi:hypothetical protein